MPVECVEFVYFHYIKISLHFVDIEEMARYVHMHSAIAESWCVLNYAALQGPVCIWGGSRTENFCRKHLLESLDSIVETVESRSGNIDCIPVNDNHICFCRHLRIKDKCKTLV